MKARASSRPIPFLLALLVFAGCTYPEPPRGAIDLAVEDDVVTALLDLGELGAELHESHDQGRTWEPVAEAEHWSQFPDYEIQLESDACTTEGTCFRIEPDSENAVWRQSANEEETPAWSFPPGRLEFLKRYELLDSFGAYDPSPRDIVAVGDVVLVAMGNDGVLRGEAAGEWTRGVLGDPKPFSEWGANLDPETLRGLMATALVMAVLMLATFAALARREGARVWKALGPWTVLGYMTTIPALLLVYVLAALGISPAGVSLFLLPTFGAAIATWSVMFPGPGDRPTGWPWALLLGVPSGGILGFGVYFLWSGGVVPWHDLATGLAAALAIGSVTLAVAAVPRSLPGGVTRVATPDRSHEELSSPTDAAIPWAGATIVAIGTLCAALVFLLPFHLDLDEGPNGPLNRLFIAAGLLGAALVVAASRSRLSSGVRYGLAGLAATALAGPGIGAMMVLPPTPPARTAPRIMVYVLYWTVGALPMFVGGLSDAPRAATFIFAVLLTVSPFCVPLADWLAIRRHRHVSAAT